MGDERERRREELDGSVYACGGWSSRDYSGSYDDLERITDSEIESYERTGTALTWLFMRLRLVDWRVLADGAGRGGDVRGLGRGQSGGVHASGAGG